MDSSNEENKIRTILENILPSIDISAVSLKSVRKQVAEQMNVDASYFSENQEKKKLFKSILEDLIFKLYGDGTDNKTNHNKTNEEKQKNNIQQKKRNSVKKREKKTKRSESENENNDEDIEKFEQDSNEHETKSKKRNHKKESNDSDEDVPKKKKRNVNNVAKSKNNTGFSRKEKLRKVVLDLKMGPTIFKDLNKDNEDEYCKTLEERIISFCEKKGICSEKNRLPNAMEVQEYRKKKKLSEELDGIDPSNIIESSTRPRRTKQNLYTPQRIPELDDEEDEEEDEEEEEEEEEDEDDEEEDMEEDTDHKDSIKKRKLKKVKSQEDEEDMKGEVENEDEETPKRKSKKKKIESEEEDENEEEPESEEEDENEDD